MFARIFPRPSLLTLLVAALLASCGGGATPVPTVDVNAMQTAAVNTAVAQISGQLTQTALATPSATSLPTNTALPTFPLATAGDASPTVASGAIPTVSLLPTTAAGITQLASPAPPAAPTAPQGDPCNNNVFEGDITIPDGSVLKPDEEIQKVWQIKNTGNCTWDDGYALVFIGDNKAKDLLHAHNFDFINSADFASPGESIQIGVRLVAPSAEGLYQGTWRMRNDAGFYFGTPLSIYFEVKKK